MDAEKGFVYQAMFFSVKHIATGFEKRIYITEALKDHCGLW